VENKPKLNQSEIRVLVTVRSYLRELFNLQQDAEREETTIEEIKKGVVFKGPSLWILLFAILIASIGLNVNSTAVIIGAMLISPLMGPIMGIGLGAGINDFALIKKAFRNLGVAALVSVITSTIYFWITPLHEAQSELLARTTPTLWDVLIAFFGGLAGIVAGSRKEKSNAIPGVAIATALMPPLCTAGYGLANGNWYYFGGALYLFFINSVFISVSTFIIVRVLKYPKKQFENPKLEQRVKTYIFTFVFLTAVPSIYLAYNLVKQTIFEQNASTFVSTEFSMAETQVIDKEYKVEDGRGSIRVTLYGKKIEDIEIEHIRSKLKDYGLAECTLMVKQGYQEDFKEATALEFQKMSENLKVGVLEDLYKKNEELLLNKDEEIRLLQTQILKNQSRIFPIQDIEAELKTQYSDLEYFAMGDMITSSSDTICYAVVDLKRRHSSKEKKKITQWLKVRSKADSLIVIHQ
jgi:uncharacterized hydrophobic protein (TIGR00271 family)